jgi:hypothetical protein
MAKTTSIPSPVVFTIVPALLDLPINRGSRAALAFPLRDKSLPQEILLLVTGMIVQRAEQVVSQCIIDPARLKGF